MKNLRHNQVKYLNNVVEADHGKLKQQIKAVRGFKTLKSAYATIKGFEVMRALRKGQAAIFNLTGDICGEARISTRSILTPITPNDRVWNAFSLHEDEAVDEYQEWLSQFGTPDMVDRDNHQFGGFPQTLQNGLQARSQLAANGLNCGGREVWKTDTAEELLKSAKDWRLVIQIRVDTHAGIPQPGAYCVIMREQDIVARRFDRAQVTYQCD